MRSVGPRPTGCGGMRQPAEGGATSSARRRASASDIGPARSVSRSTRMSQSPSAASCRHLADATALSGASSRSTEPRLPSSRRDAASTCAVSISSPAVAGVESRGQRDRG